MSSCPISGMGSRIGSCKFDRPADRDSRLRLWQQLSDVCRAPLSQRHSRRPRPVGGGGRQRRGPDPEEFRAFHPARHGGPELTCDRIRKIEASPDVVLALHACDTATDEAIALAVRLGARLL